MEIVRTSLTVFFDGRFWTALVERNDGNSICIARHVFGPEPGTAEIQQWVQSGYGRLQFVPVDPDALARLKPEKKINPKRAKREVARALSGTKAISKAHRAMRLFIEARKPK